MEKTEINDLRIMSFNAGVFELETQTNRMIEKLTTLHELRMRVYPGIWAGGRAPDSSVVIALIEREIENLEKDIRGI